MWAMPRISPYNVILRPEERRELETRSAKYTLPYFQVVRARMILHAAEGLSNDQIAERFIESIFCLLVILREQISFIQNSHVTVFRIVPPVVKKIAGKGTDDK